MARTKRSRRSYGAGEWGRNRVRVFPDPKTGLYQLEWRENGRRLTAGPGLRAEPLRANDRKSGTLRAGTATGSPVRGLRVARGFWCRTLSVPKPRIRFDSAEHRQPGMPMHCQGRHSRRTSRNRIGRT